jgi:hypothetical protein
LHTIDLNRFDTSEENLFSLNGKTRKPVRLKKVVFVALSIVLHLSVITMFIVYGPTALEPIQDATTSLKSYLVIKPLPIQAAKPEIAQPEIKDSETSELQTIEPQINAPVLKQQVLEVPQIENAEVSASLEEKQKLDMTLREKSEPPAKSSKVHSAQTQSPQTTNSAMVNTPIDLSEAIGKYQKQIHRAKVQSMAEQAAKAYRKAKTSPEINTATTVSYEERSAALRKIEVDCASLLKKGLSILSYLGGGTVDCRNNNNFQEYINKHLNNLPLEEEQ